MLSALLLNFATTALDLSKVTMKHIRDCNCFNEIKVSNHIDGQHVARFYLFRHGVTSWSFDDIVQGTSLDAEINVLTPKDAENISMLKKIDFDYLFTGNSIRSYSPCELLQNDHSILDGSWVFREQNLGLFEGRSRSEVKADKEFRKMSVNPDYYIEGVELGRDVINRMLFGIDAVAKDGETIGICGSNCAMNWFLKWATNDYFSVYNITNLGIIPFDYDIDTKTISFPFEKKVVTPAELLDLLKRQH